MKRRKRRKTTGAETGEWFHTTESENSLQDGFVLLSGMFSTNW